MWRRSRWSGWGPGSMAPRRQRGFVRYDYATVVILVSAGILLLLYLLGYLRI